jgi:hypothetical protein
LKQVAVRRRIAGLLAATIAFGPVAIIFRLCFKVWIPTARHIYVANVIPEAGLSYAGDLTDATPTDHKDLDAGTLYMVEIRGGSPLHLFQDLLSGSYAYGWLTALADAYFPALTYESWVALKPGDSRLEDIRQKGDGRYLIRQDRLYFSLPKGIYFAAVQRLEVVVPFYKGSAVDEIGEILWIVAVFAAAGLIVRTGWSAVARLYRESQSVRNIMSGLAITCVMFAAAFVAAEMYLRFANKFPKSMIALPHRFVPEVGFLYEPGAEIRWTNGLDFWTTQRANSLGFADDEPVIPKPAGTFRILLIGDSFVEALQVPPERKLQSLLGNALQRQFPEGKYDVVAMGYAGTGQANQLPFIEKYNEKIKADLVVLLFVDNDFANNSPLLESVRRGWHPDYPPMLFFRLGSTGQCQRVEISSDYMHRQLPGATEAGHVKVLRSLSPEYSRKLEGWDPEKNPMDSVFFSEGTLPPVFEEAVELTKCAFAAWKTRAEQDGFQLMVLATDNVTKGPGMRSPQYGQIHRLRAITQELHLPLLDLYPIFLKRGGPELARWTHDAHWNPTGHRWASEALIDFLKRGRYLRASGTARTTTSRPGN